MIADSFMRPLQVLNLILLHIRPIKLLALPEVMNTNAEYPKTWGLGFRPPSSPDLISLDFYFRGYVRQIMYCVRMHNIQHLK
jgi:hypothetical protein